VSPQDRRVTDSGIEIESTYGPESLEGWDPAADLGRPGEYPFTRGVHPQMYRDRLWTMRQYSGFGTAEQTNERFKFLLERGQTGLSVAFDLPTQMGYDSDHPRAEGEVGGTGVAISTVEDMEILLQGIPLDFVSTSMTINATAPILLLAYELVAERNGVAADRIRGTVQNDILKEYSARGTYIFPPRQSMRLVTDLFAYCQKRIPRWNVISISGYHMREAGCTAVQEVAFTLANAIAYVSAALDAGVPLDALARRISFFFACHMNFFEEVAKFRAARRMWARIMKERFGAEEEASWLRFHTQTGGATLTAQQPENNIVRTAYEALAAVLGGTQSLHTNSFDEALSLPSEKAAKIALRTQQVLGFETGVGDTVDPLGGSWFVERLTNEIEGQAEELLERIDAMGGGRDRSWVGQAPDRGVGVPHAAGHRGPEPGGRRRQPLRRARRPGADRPARPRRHGQPHRSPRPGQGQSPTRRRRRGARPGPHRRRRLRQPPLSHPGSPLRLRHARRDL
jgi:methylmalonyl-CoA mutase N-terminal domain/subunit